MEIGQGRDDEAPGDAGSSRKVFPEKGQAGIEMQNAGLLHGSSPLKTPSFSQRHAGLQDLERAARFWHALSARKRAASFPRDHFLEEQL